MSELASRYRENHARLLAARERLQQAVDTGTATAHDRKRLDTVTELLTPVKGTAVDANGNVVPVERPRQFLSVDPEGQGRAVEVHGDLEQARNVAVLVPGMGNSLETFRGQSDRADLIRAESGPGTAAIAWLDYDSPQGFVEAASKQAALDGGPRLAGFMTELKGLTDATTTLVGHSYGTDVVGQALLNGGRADRVVLTGSPGITKYVDEAADFVQPPTRLYVERAPGDYVSYSEWHGPDPANFPDAIRMATNGDEAISVHWHNEYYRVNSEALRNIGRVVRGDLASITTTSTTRPQETKLAWGTALNKAAGVAHKVYDGLAPPAARRPVTTPDRPAVDRPDPDTSGPGRAALDRAPSRPTSTAPAAGRPGGTRPRQPEGPRR